jgi:acyl dehydratase
VEASSTPTVGGECVRAAARRGAMLAGMSARIINGPDELKSLVGEHLGYSPYVEISQDQVNLFADATGDHQWIHVDVEKAKAGPFGGPIAHGYLTLSLGPYLYPAGRADHRASRWASTTAPTRSGSRRRSWSARSCASA